MKDKNKKAKSVSIMRREDEEVFAKPMPETISEVTDSNYALTISLLHTLNAIASSLGVVDIEQSDSNEKMPGDIASVIESNREVLLSANRLAEDVSSRLR